MAVVSCHLRRLAFLTRLCCILEPPSAPSLIKRPPPPASLMARIVVLLAPIPCLGTLRSGRVVISSHLRRLALLTRLRPLALWLEL
jgi:hypothetical protein